MTLVFPYRGTYVRHVGDDEVVADASQVLFFHAGEDYQVSHPNPGGDASLALSVDETLLREIAPPALLRSREPLRFREPRLRIDPRAQVLVALLRRSLHEGIAEPLEGESLALTLVLACDLAIGYSGACPSPAYFSCNLTGGTARSARRRIHRLIISTNTENAIAA
jgi:hypothetical protein